MSADDNKKMTKDEELDSFWTLEETLPSKKRRGRFSEDTDTVLIELDDKQSDDNQSTGTFREVLGYTIPKSGAQKLQQSDIRNTYKPIPVLEYVRENSLVTKVSVWQWPSKYQFYERFQSDAERYFERKGYPCSHVNYFSYIPQYIQLNRDQLEWYFWWRECVRNGEYPQTDYSYILLYIYEVINLPEKIKPDDGVKLLVSLWLNCRDRHKKLDALMSELICDYCLINRIAPPTDMIGDKLTDLITSMSLKEFYLSELDITNDRAAYAKLLMNLSSNYDWHTSKYNTAEYAEAFRKHIPEAFTYAVCRLSEQNVRYFANIGQFTSAKVTRDAYAGSLCAYNVKRRIDVEYRTFTRSIELRLIVTDLIKCAENGVRAMLKIKARLSVPNLSDEHKQAVADYFAQFRNDPIYGASSKKAKTVPEYEKQYDAESGPLSIEGAQQLENISWNVAQVLGELEPEPAESTPIPEPAVVSEPKAAPETIPESPVRSEDTAASPVIRGLKLLADGNSAAFAELAASLNMFEDTLAEQINEALYDSVGDIVLVYSGEGYNIIEDYREDVTAYIAENSGGTEDK